MIRWAKVTEVGRNSGTYLGSAWISESAVSCITELDSSGCVINFFDEKDSFCVKEDFYEICDSWDSWGNDE